MILERLSEIKKVISIIRTYIDLAREDRYLDRAYRVYISTFRRARAVYIYVYYIRAARLAVYNIRTARLAVYDTRTIRLAVYNIRTVCLAVYDIYTVRLAIYNIYTTCLAVYYVLIAPTGVGIS